MIALDRDTLTIKELANRFLDDRQHEITPDWYRKHRRALRRFVRHVGAGRAWNDLTPDDFAVYGRYLHGKLGGNAFNRERSSILAMFNHASAMDWIDHCPKLGVGFKRVSRGKLRSTRVARLLSSEDLRKLYAAARPQFRAMILLGLNGGFGGADCAALPWSAIQDGVIRFARVKNNIPRTVPLWPETVAALAPLKRGGDLVFYTKHGNPWSGTVIAQRFSALCRKAEVTLPRGVGLYACRHTFATFANEVRDTDARRHLMGRMLPNLDDVYVEGMFLERLQRVTDHVRERLNIADVVENGTQAPALPHDPLQALG